MRIDLPDKQVTLGAPHGGENAWWSNNDQNDADVRLTREVAVPAGTDVRFWSWNDYVIEELWDYGFIEVSTDGGTNWTQLEVHAEDGTVVSTDDDPNGNLENYFGGLENGLTGRQRRLPAPVRRPHAVRGIDDPAAAALRHGRGVHRARLVRRRLLADQRRRDGVDRRRRGAA